jgi:uncharacterized membrane protein YfcA
MIEHLSVLSISLLCALAYCAGLIDSVVGGGGLIQIPALFNVFPATHEATLFGTNKLAAVCGTSVAARSYFGKVHIAWSLVLPAALAAFVMAFLGAATVSFIPRGVLRPLVLALIVVMAVYVFWKKDFGKLQRPLKVGTRERVLSVLIGGAIGFYDGLFGPGTGSFLIFLFIRFFAFDFLQASASAKFVNIATNLAALAYFVPTGNVLYLVAIPMAVFNMLGAYTGTWVAMKHGAGLIRILFLILLFILIFKLAYDMLGSPVCC